MTKLGERIRQLREENNFLQKHIAAQLDVDTPMLSKIERGERRAKKEQVLVLASILNVPQADLLTLWLADQVYEIVKDEDVALKAIQVAEDEVKFKQKKK
ncbi:helix-turn-helix domain-containing protein [Chitinophagaceae bacterium LB-8]|uniref:Helix-turn-helix domain-containing protein n=1 Tax=Paraflavisolibacter caeni TaxID=2982496 RepID=A0A9X3BJX8_9BACT|nr:helix-turn-helix transcriptional regulator [Paraflavisolibacter caeni]MCU7551783.1 helix-turn-helix domain-containing protein [Paraflavisolibacter caeni]